MANSGLLTQGMTVEQAQLLDQRLRKERDAPFRQPQGNYGGGALGGLLSASGQAINSAALAGRNIGEAAGDAMTGREGRGREHEMKAKAQETEVLKAFKVDKGITEYQRLMKVADNLSSIGTTAAVAKADNMYTRAEELKLNIDSKKAQVDYQNDIVDIKKQEVDARKAIKVEQGRIAIDDKGNHYTRTMVRGEGNAVVEHLVPMSGSPEVPVGRLRDYTSVQIKERNEAAENQVKNNTFYQTIKPQAQKIVQSELKSLRNINKTLKLIEGGRPTGGWASDTRLALEKVFGSVPVDAGEAEVKLGRLMVAELKATFGGQLSDGERKTWETLNAHLTKGKEVNIALLKNAIEEANTRMKYALNATEAGNYAEWDSGNKAINKELLSSYFLETDVAEEVQPINSPNAALIQQATAALARKKAEANARNASSLNNPNISTSY